MVLGVFEGAVCENKRQMHNERVRCLSPQVYGVNAPSA
jgi:hypothetical protein